MWGTPHIERLIASALFATDIWGVGEKPPP